METDDSRRSSEHRPPADDREKPVDVSQLLRPRAKKLTLIDARRVMSIYEETTRRVQLVGGLLEQTSITAAVKRLGASLGADLVDALTQYSSILDLFDEVVSWREMAISDTRGPVAPAGAGAARTSIGSTREDSIFAMLFRPDDDSLEPLPDVASSILFQASALSQLSSMQGSVEVLRSHHLFPSSPRALQTVMGRQTADDYVVNAHVDQFLADAPGSDINQPSSAGRRSQELNASSVQIGSGVRSTLNPKDAELVSSLAKFEPPMSTSGTFKGVDNIRPNVPAGVMKRPFGLASIPSQLMSGSDIVVQLGDLGSIPSFQFFLTPAEVEEMAGVKPDAIDPDRRVHVATRSLVKTRVEMERNCHNIIQLFANNPIAMNVVLKELLFSAIVQEFIAQLNELRSVVFERLLTTPLEVLQRKEFLEDMQSNKAKCDAAIAKLHHERSEITAVADQKLKAAEDEIVELQQNIGNIQHFSDDGIRRARQEASKRRAGDRKSSTDRQAVLQAEVGSTRALLAKVRKDLWSSEAELRKKKYKLETEIDNRIQKFDIEMQALQDEFDEVEAQYKIEKAQLTELELRFEPLEAEFKAILEERDVAYRARLTADREAVRRRQAALTLQAWWRSYRVRKACQVAAKKRAKAAAKEKKGKGKGKKGKEKKVEDKPPEAVPQPAEPAAVAE